MTKREKPEKYVGGMVVFPEGDGRFDQKMSEEIRSIIQKTIAEVERPTKASIAERLGMVRERLTRIMTALGMDEDYRRIRKTKFALYRNQIRLERELAEAETESPGQVATDSTEENR